jgi:uncharacterized membrane protein YvbJ
MFCRKCGQEVSDEAIVCIHCGCAVDGSNASTIKKGNSAEMDTSKTGIGILLGWFLGILGLIIGLCIYHEGTVARKTFVKAWGITFAITTIISIIVGIVSYTFMMGLMEEIMSTVPAY